MYIGFFSILYMYIYVVRLESSVVYFILIGDKKFDIAKTIPNHDYQNEFLNI